MKKLFLTSVCVAALLVTIQKAGAVGAVAADNYDPFEVPVYAVGGSTFASTFFVQINYSLNGVNWSTAQGGLSGTQTVFTQAEAGFFDAGSVTLPGVANNQSGVYFQIIAWQGASELANATTVGYSDVWQQTVGNIDPSPATPAPAALAIVDADNKIILTAVPEPTTVVLGALGGLALLARRRRNA